uniref:Uncharacterized protein n=1 Tax=Populus davidiana TaxID=266767 RepID=A0A6M2EI21_9ROSI
MLLSSGNPFNFSCLNFGRLNPMLVLLSSPMTPFSSDLVPPLSHGDGSAAEQNQEDGTKLSMLLQSLTLITSRDSQISFALQMLLSSGNPFNFSCLNFGSW